MKPLKFFVSLFSSVVAFFTVFGMIEYALFFVSQKSTVENVVGVVMLMLSIVPVVLNVLFVSWIVKNRSKNAK